MARIFLISLFVIALAAGGAYYFGVFSANGGNNAQLIFKAPNAIFYGAPFELSIGVANNSTEFWRDASLSLSLPKTLVFADGAGAKSISIKQLGMLGDGSLTEVKFNLIAIEAEHNEDGFASTTEDVAAPALDAFSQVEARLMYAFGKNTTLFEKREIWRAPAPAPAIAVALTAPEHVKSGEEFKIKIDYENVAGADMDGLSLHMQYPEGFVFSKATSDADAYNADWTIGALLKGSKDSITIFGHMEKVVKSEFTAIVRRNEAGSMQPIARARATVAVEEPPLAVTIDINDSPENIARLGETLIYTIAYSLDKAVDQKKGITVRAMPLSQLFDFGTVVVNDGGLFRSDVVTGAPEIVWFVKNPSSEGGSVSFSIKAQNEYGIKRLSDRNFTLKLRAEVKAGTTVGSVEREIKISGLTAVEARGYFRDADSGMVNQGVMPPLVGVPTQYTVHWIIKNYATDVKDVVVRAKLQPGTRFVVVGKSTVDSKPAYNPSTNEVVWKIGRISATTGVLGLPPEALFQIEGTPTADMRGLPMPLMSSIIITALDDFTGAIISGSASEITSVLLHDQTVAGQGNVQ